VGDPLANFPGNVSRVRIHRDAMTPGRLLAGPCVGAGVVDVAGPRIAFAPLEAGCRSHDTVPAISVAALSGSSFLDPADACFVLRIHEYVSQSRIGSRTTPVHASN